MKDYYEKIWSMNNLLILPVTSFWAIQASACTRADAHLSILVLKHVSSSHC